MDIKKNLPFECCETCNDFILHTEEQVIFVSEKGYSERILIVGCKNDNSCRRLEYKRWRHDNGNGI